MIKRAWIVLLAAGGLAAGAYLLLRKPSGAEVLRRMQGALGTTIHSEEQVFIAPETMAVVDAVRDGRLTMEEVQASGMHHDVVEAIAWWVQSGRSTSDPEGGFAAALEEGQRARASIQAGDVRW